MKTGALLFAIACVVTPAYGVYANAVGRQESKQIANTLDSGEIFVNDEKALMRARFCEVIVRGGTDQIIPTLIGVDGMTLGEGDPGPQFVCAPDGTTVKQRGGEFAEYVAVSERGLARYHDILKVRGLITEEHTAGFQHDTE